MKGVAVGRWARHTPYTDPGGHGAVLEALPADVGRLGEVVRGALVHYRCGQEFGAERLAEIDHRWVGAMLDTDQARSRGVWGGRREWPLVGCCRDFALVTVAALRARGVAARTRVGFASYLHPGFGTDHVVVEYWDGGRWVWADTQVDPALPWPMDAVDIVRSSGAAGAVFASAASGDEPRPAPVGQIGIEPVGEHGHAVAEADQIEDVDPHPGEPGGKPIEFQVLELDDGSGATDRGEHPLVAVAEGEPPLAADAAHDVVGHRAPLLHGHGGQAGERLPILAPEVGDVPDGEDLRVAGDRAILGDDDSPLPVSFHVEFARQVLGDDAGGP